MTSSPGSRGIVIGDRYRVAGTLRRHGIHDAVDCEAPPTDAACRVARIEGDAEAWEDAWREAQETAPVPRLIEVIAHDGGDWAVIAAATAIGPASAALAGEVEAAGAALAGGAARGPTGRPAPT